MKVYSEFKKRIIDEIKYSTGDEGLTFLEILSYFPDGIEASEIQKYFNLKAFDKIDPIIQTFKDIFIVSNPEKPFILKLKIDKIDIFRS